MPELSRNNTTFCLNASESDSIGNDENCHSTVASWSPSAAEAGILSSVLVVGLLLSTALSLGIVWYESIVSGAYRTLINKVAALSCGYNVLLSFFFHLTIVARLLHGTGLHEGFCFVFVSMGLSCLIQIAFVHNE